MQGIFTFSLLIALVGRFDVLAFGIHPSKTFTSRSICSKITSSASDTVIDVEASITPAKAFLLEVAQRLNDEYGVFVIDSKAIDELESAVKDLESTCPLFDENYQREFLGDWTLICTTATANSSPSSGVSFLGKGIDTSKIPFFNEGPSKDIRTALNKQWLVKQVIRSENGVDVDRVDHVLQYQPPNTLSEIWKNLPKELSNLNINPLNVSQGKITLIHKATVESVSPLKTKLTLQSVVLTVAGTSRFLDPNGKDILGINVPVSEFLNSGNFETTYMDSDLRISRGKVGLVDQLRVFVRTKSEQFEEDPLNENVGDVDVGGARDETEEAVSDSAFDGSQDDLSPSA